jgi:hypothetical protein
MCSSDSTLSKTPQFAWFGYTFGTMLYSTGNYFNWPVMGAQCLVIGGCELKPCSNRLCQASDF